MMRNLLRPTLVVLLLAVFCQVTHSDPLRREGQLRNWNSDPAIVELDTTQDLFALGDVHGDHKRLANLLVACRAIESVPDAPNHAVSWCDKSVLICTGDLIDKWHHGFE